MKNSSQVQFAIFVAALGYFVDVFDIILFTAVRVPSLTSLGLLPDQITSSGIFLLNCQLVGMVIGGLGWGMLGDKKGRLSVLFGSILLYSLANLANAFVHDVSSYAILRFIAGVGLAGELGAGVTLVSELMHKRSRGIGTMIVAVAGCLGGVAGAYMANYFDWRVMYMIGGGMGLLLLFLRWRVSESSMFENLLSQNVKRGDLFFFIRSKDLMMRYLKCLGIGVPFWVFIGLIATLAPEISKGLGMTVPIAGAKAIMFLNIGVAIGELSSSLLSQLLGSRKKVVAGYLTFTLICIISLVSQTELTENDFYIFYTLLGTGAGYWAVFLMFSVEQFGTNLRATASISLPNFVRGMVVPLSLILTVMKPVFGIIHSLGVIVFFVFLIAYVSLFFTKETFGSDLNFNETI